MKNTNTIEYIKNACIPKYQQVFLYKYDIGEEMGLMKLHVLFAAAVCDECQVGEKQAGRQRGDFGRDNDKEDEERDQRTKETVRKGQ